MAEKPAPFIPASPEETGLPPAFWRVFGTRSSTTASSAHTMRAPSRFRRMKRCVSSAPLSANWGAKGPDCSVSKPDRTSALPAPATDSGWPVR